MTVRVTKSNQPRIRVDETGKGLTFEDLCELVDQGREVGIGPSTPVFCNTRLPRMSESDRPGYRAKWLEV